MKKFMTLWASNAIVTLMILLPLWYLFKVGEVWNKEDDAVMSASCYINNTPVSCRNKELTDAILQQYHAGEKPPIQVRLYSAHPTDTPDQAFNRFLKEGKWKYVQ